MSVDLTLLPFDGEDSNLAFSHTILNVYANYDLHDQIKKLPKLDVPASFTSFYSRQESDYTQYGVTTEDCYGQPVKYTTVKELLTIKDKYWTCRSVPVHAYLKCLEPDTKVALFWH